MTAPVVLATAVGGASGSKAAAAALACAASESDRAALLIDLDDGRPPRPSLVATAGARRLEERLVAHMPDAAVASRGRICQLTLPAVPDSCERIAAALPLVREAAAVVHLFPGLLRSVLEDSRVQPTAVLLRAGLASDRSLTALAAGDLMARGLSVAVLKRSLGWLTARAALLGASPDPNGGLPSRLCEQLLATEDRKFHHCYDGRSGTEDDRGEAHTSDKAGP